MGAPYKGVKQNRVRKKEEKPRIVTEKRQSSLKKGNCPAD